MFTSTNNFTPTKQGGFLMENKLKSFTFLLIMGLTIFAFPLVFQEGKLWAVCSGDSDCDGFPDFLEANLSLTLKDNTSVTVDPNKMDLFIVLQTAIETQESTISYIPSDPLMYITQTSGGLKINVHLIKASQLLTDNINDPSDRLISSSCNQKAIRIVETLLDGGDTNMMGKSNPGTPNGAATGIIYTGNIMKYLSTVYGSNIDSTIRDKYIRHVIAHEIGHMVGPMAAVKYNAKLGGYHYAPGSNTVMDQSVQYKNNAWTIGATFTTADQNGTHLFP
jgi:hypothetical protein